MALTKPSNITLQYAQKQDAPALAVLGKYTFEQTYLPLAPAEQEEIIAYSSRVFALAQVTQDLEQTHIQYIIAKEEQDGESTQLLGYVKLNTQLTTPSLPIENTVCIERFYVHPDYKKQQIGTQLMEYVLEELKKEDFFLVWLCVWDINKAVMQFYEKFGFRHIGVHPYLMENTLYEDLLMVKEF